MNNKEEFKRNSINVHQRLGTSMEVSSEQMDNERLNTRTYDYLCRLEEAKSWVSNICKVPDSYSEFEEEMRKGVFLAKIAKFYNNDSVPYIFTDTTLQYRHTDNINFFLNTLLILKLPKHYFFEVIDLYEKKNFPKVVYCLHALAMLLKNKGLSGGIKKADGQVFKQSDIERIDSELANINLPNFLNIDCEDNERSLLEEQARMELLNLSEDFNNEEKDNISDSYKFKKIGSEKSNITSTNHQQNLEETELIIEPLNRNNYNDIDTKLKLSIHSFLMKKSFNDIYYKKSVSIFSLRRFLFIFFKKSNEMIKEQQIDHLHKIINYKLKEIYNKEIYLEGIENRIKLMIDNKLDLYKIKKKVTNDYKFLSDIFSQLIHNKKYIIDLLYENIDLNIILKLFNYCSTIKEEYLFINLILDIPIDLSYNLMIAYFRSSKESETLNKGIDKIIKNLSNLDVLCDPTEIYKELFDSEIDSIDKALENNKVQEIFQKRLSTLRGVLKSFMNLIQSINLPYILKYYLSVNKIECIQFFKDFIFPLFIYNESKNLSPDEISRMDKNFKFSDILNQEVYNDKEDVFDNIDENNFQKNIKKSSLRNKILVLVDVLICIINDEDVVSYYLPICEEFKIYNKSILNKYSLENLSLDLYFQKESINELVRVQKSIIYLTVKEINSILLILNRLNLYDVELIVEDDNLNISLSILNTDWINEHDEEDVGLDNFIKQVKKKLIYVLSICRGTNVMDVLLKESSDDENETFKKLISEETQENFDRNNCDSKLDNTDNLINIDNKSTNSDNLNIKLKSSSNNCLSDLNLNIIKEQLIDDLKFLEKKEIVSHKNLYGEILSLIANDIIVLRFMSVERNKELKVNELTFSNLLSKEEYLDLKIKEYDEYLIQYSISQLNKKKRNTDYMIGKLQMNSVYGSYYFKSNELVDLGVLNQVYNIPDSRDLCFVLASDEPLKFKLHIFIDNCTITDPWIFRLEDLLMRKNEVIDVLQVCSFKVDMLIKVINQRYLGN